MGLLQKANINLIFNIKVSFSYWTKIWQAPHPPKYKMQKCYIYRH